MTRRHAEVFRTYLLVAVLTCVAAGCSGAKEAVVKAVPRDNPTVVLVSIDGFRWDFLDLHDAPNLNALAKQGVRGDGLIPVFPSQTFPNHYSMVTGLYPASHGIVGNRFFDPDLDRSFKYSNAEDNSDSTWWGGEPIWITAGKHGLRSAVYFWPGSETIIDGRRPDYWFQFDDSVPGSERVDQALRWLDAPGQSRPAFIGLYFSDVDRASHENGPESPETGQAVRKVDAYVGRLVSGLAIRGILDEVNLLFVSDHGHARRDPSKVIYLEDYFDLSKVRIVEYGPTTSMWPVDVTVAEVYESLYGAHPNLSVYTRETMPSRWHYEGSPRIAPIVAVADEGWTFGRRAKDNPDWHRGGDHGYDPSLRSMHALFVAHGPAFKEHVTLPEFEAIDLYPLMADILNIKPAPNDGSLTSTSAARSALQSPQLSSK